MQLIHKTITGRRPIKMRHKEESVYAPRSLFDRPSPALIKMRRDMKLQKYRGIVRPPVPMPGIKPTPALKPVPEPDHVLEWMIHEDWALLQAIQVYQGLPLNLMILSPGHTPNWDLVADIVNNTSRIYRSPKQCRSRYESVIVPREEGKLLYDTTPKKQKKQKGVYKMPQVSEVIVFTCSTIFFYKHWLYCRFLSSSISNRLRQIVRCERLNCTIRTRITLSLLCAVRDSTLLNQCPINGLRP